jgi:hypothetical protein
VQLSAITCKNKSKNVDIIQNAKLHQFMWVTEFLYLHIIADMRVLENATNIELFEPKAFFCSENLDFQGP